MKRCLTIAVSLLALAATPAVFLAQSNAEKPAPVAKPAAAGKAILPDAFAGWAANAAPKPIAEAAQAASSNAAALAEFGFSGAERADYKRGSATLSLLLLRFQDVTGAYGAFSSIRQNNWAKELIGAGAASFHNRVLFWQGNLVVEANLSKIDPMTGSDLRELAKALPVIEGRKAITPPVLDDLPKANLVERTTHYAVGPAGYAAGGAVLPADLVSFSMGAELVTANYSLRSGSATLTVIEYPTPQMAAAQEQKIHDFLKAGPQPNWPKLLQDSNRAALEVKHSGPIVALVSGDPIPEEAHKLLASVHYSAELTNLPQVGGDTEISKTGKLLVGIATLVMIGVGAAILLGFFLGGGRALYRIARGKPVSSVHDAEFIRLNLND